MKKLDSKIVAELKAKHGDELGYVDAKACTLIFRKPTEPEHSRMLDKIAASSGAQARVAMRELAMCCVVFPGADALREAIDAEPAILMSDVAPLLNELSGERERERGKL